MSDPTDLAALRQRLGLTVPELAALLGLDGDNAADHVRAIERRARPITGPVQRLADLIAAADERGYAQVIPRRLLYCERCEDQVVPRVDRGDDLCPHCGLVL